MNSPGTARNIPIRWAVMMENSWVRQARLYLILNFNERVPPSTTDTAKPREREEHVAIPAEKEPGSHDA